MMSKRCGNTPSFFVVLLLTAALGWTAPAAPARAQDWSAEEDLRNRINLAGRQRMLSQQVALYACFVMANVEKDRYIAKVEASVRQFDQYQAALLHGSSDLRVRAEENPDVQERLSDIVDVWHTLNIAARQMSAGDLHAVPLAQVIRLNVDVMDRSDAAVQAIQSAHVGGMSDAALIETIDVAGRQRMLSQKIAKETCYLNLGLGGADKRQSLADNRAEFQTALADLLAGSDARGLVAPPTRQIKKQLERVQRAWHDFEKVVLIVENDGVLDPGDMVKLANLSQQVLLEMDLAVVMFLQS